jgi:DNA-binding NarL/FixJ family response regulator
VTHPTWIHGLLPEATETRQNLALDLAALLQRMGVTAVVRNPESQQTLAYTDDAIVRFRELGPEQFRREHVALCGVEFLVETPAAKPGERLHGLTPRQATILQLVASGRRNKEIAEELGISTHTVRRHVESLLRRLNVPNRAAAAVMLRAADEDVEAGPVAVS